MHCAFSQLCPVTVLAFISFPSFKKMKVREIAFVCVCVPLVTFGVIWLPTQCTSFVHSFTLFISVITKSIWIEFNMRNLSFKA
jgi:hypothetical protein